MAKDKGKKKDKTSDDGFAKPSEAPAGGGGWSLTDGDEPKSGKNDGKLFLITPLRSEHHADTHSKKPGETKEHIVADIVELNEKKPAKSVEHEEVWIFGGWLMGATRAYIGERRVLGRLDKTPDAKSATGYVWKFADADPDDEAVAREYLASLDPFKTGKGKAEKPVDRVEKKSKKSKAEPEPEPKKKDKGKKAEPEKPAKKKSKKK